MFLPGSNLLSKGTVINHGRVKALVERVGKIKPHPHNCTYIYGRKKRVKIWKAENVLNKKEGGFELLLNCKEMACSQNSEMGR